MIKLNNSDARKILVIAVVLYIITFSVLSVLKNEAYNSTAFDLGIFDQTIWGYSHFQNIFNTVRGTILLGDHADPINFLIAPVYRLMPTANTLLVIQAIMMGLAAVPLYFIARKALKNETAALFIALSYLVYPTTQYINLFDFHPAALAIFPLMLATYALIEKRYLLMILSLSAAAMCKEHYTLAMITFGAYIFIVHKKKLLGTLVALLGALWFIFNIEILIPMFSQTGYQHFTGYTYLLTDFAGLFTIGKLGYLALLAFPFALGIFLVFGFDFLLLAAPFFGINLLRQSTGLTSVIYQHNSELLAFLFTAASFGIARIASRFKKNYTVMFSAVVFVMCIIALLIYGPFTTIYGPQTFNTANAAGVKELVAMIPQDASVSASTWAVPHLSHRKEIYMFPNPFWQRSYGADYLSTSFEGGKTDYVLLDTGRIDPNMNQTFTQEVNSYILSNSDYNKVAEKGSWILLKKIS